MQCPGQQMGKSRRLGSLPAWHQHAGALGAMSWAATSQAQLCCYRCGSHLLMATILRAMAAMRPCPLPGNNEA